MLISGKFPYAMKTGRSLTEAEVRARAGAVSADLPSPPSAPPPPPAPKKPEGKGWKAKRAARRSRARPGVDSPTPVKSRSASPRVKMEPRQPPYVLRLDETFLELADVRRSQCKPATVVCLILMAPLLLISLAFVFSAVEDEKPSLALVLVATGPLMALMAGEALKIFRNRKNRAVFNRSTGRATFYENGRKVLERPWTELFFCMGGRGLGPGPVSDWEFFNIKLAGSGLLHPHSSGGDGHDVYWNDISDDTKIDREQLDGRPAYLFCHLIRPGSQYIEATWAFAGGEAAQAQSYWLFVDDFMTGHRADSSAT